MTGAAPDPGAATDPTPDPRPDRCGAQAGWFAACVVYLFGVLHRSSLGVAGLQAAARFGIGPSALSVFVLLQLGIYAAMQIPAGVLVDRLGPRRMLLTAALIMGGAQLLFAWAHTYPVALLARALLGAGDAMTFISVVSFIAARFPERRFPVYTALTGTFGIVGNVVATVPLTLALVSFGWTPSFALCGLASLCSAAGVWVFVGAPADADRLRLRRRGWRAPTTRIARNIRAGWASPGTRTGFWVHFTCMSATTTFGVLWGQPYLVRGLGLSREAASAILLTGVLAAAISGPLIGLLIGRRPIARLPLSVTVCAVTIVGWLLVLVPGSTSPLQVGGLVCLMSIGGPAAMVGFAVARDYNPANIVGTATGIVNVGGFLAAVLGSLGVGFVLDVTGQDAAGFRLAMLVLVAVQSFGLVFTVRAWRHTRAFLLVRQANGHQVPVRVNRTLFDIAGLPDARPVDPPVAPGR